MGHTGHGSHGCRYPYLPKVLRWQYIAVGAARSQQDSGCCQIIRFFIFIRLHFLISYKYIVGTAVYAPGKKYVTAIVAFERSPVGDGDVIV